MIRLGHLLAIKPWGGLLFAIWRDDEVLGQRAELVVEIETPLGGQPCLYWAGVVVGSGA